MRPVSYTHLDVYKRQNIVNILILLIFEIFALLYKLLFLTADDFDITQFIYGLFDNVSVISYYLTDITTSDYYWHLV